MTSKELRALARETLAKALRGEATVELGNLAIAVLHAPVQKGE